MWSLAGYQANATAVARTFPQEVGELFSCGDMPDTNGLTAAAPTGRIAEAAGAAYAATSTPPPSSAPPQPANSHARAAHSRLNSPPATPSRQTLPCWPPTASSAAWHAPWPVLVMLHGLDRQAEHTPAPPLRLTGERPRPGPVDPPRGRRALSPAGPYSSRAS